MPSSSAHGCAVQGCPRLAPRGQPRCAAHQVEGLRPTAHERGYTNKWYDKTKVFLALHPICGVCDDLGQFTKATLVDHKKPHRGDLDLFWNESNWQPLCSRHHAAKTAGETGGRVPATLPDLELPQCPVMVICSPSVSLSLSVITPLMTPNDLLLHVDQLAASISGKPLFECEDEITLRRAGHARNNVLRRLAGPVGWSRVWFLVPAPRMGDRRHWRYHLHSRPVVLAATPDVAMQHICNDEYEGKPRRLEQVKDWWTRYVADYQDVTTTTAKACRAALEAA